MDNFIEGRLNQIYNDNLSGEQRTRISIARELIGNKPILIMDEGASNLDKTTAINIERRLLQTKELTVSWLLIISMTKIEHYLTKL